MKSLATILALILVVGLYQVDAMEAEEEGGIVLQVVQKACASCQPVGDEFIEDNDNDNASCDDGFEEVEGICQDIDECSDNANLCSVNETCINTPGNFECNCNEGFRRVGEICEDIDECSDNANPCGFGETCVNTPGNFECNCIEFFTRVGDICEVMDGCTINDNPCGVNETCVLKTWNWNCSCNEGFTKVLGICEECVSPSLYLEDLGCISLLSDEERTYDDASDKCEEEGKRLLEEVEKKHLQPITVHFLPLVGSLISVWIGMVGCTWVNSRTSVDKYGSIWIKGEPTMKVKDCGFINLDLDELGLGDDKCHFTHYAFCQSLPD